MSTGPDPIAQGMASGQPVAQGLAAGAGGAPCVQHWTYDPCALGTPLNALRLQLADTDFTNVGASVPQGQRSALFSDEEYAGLLAMAAGDVTMALIRALYVIASNRALMAVAVNLGGGGEVNFTQVARELRAQAQALWEWYASVPAEAFSEVDTNHWAAQRIFWNETLRRSAF